MHTPSVPIITTGFLHTSLLESKGKLKTGRVLNEVSST